MSTVAELDERARQLLPEIAAGAAERERRREMPFVEIRRLARAGLLTYRVPRSHGGPGSTVEEALAFVLALAAVDSNIAQALRPCFLFIEGLRRIDSEDERRRWFSRVLAGEVFGTAGWERGGANGEVRTRITREGDHFRVSGTKSYSTGALFADWVSSTAVDEEGRRVHFTVPRDREGLRVLDDWDGAGQTLTASGTTLLEGLLVHEDEVRRRGGGEEGGGRRSPGTALAQLFLATVLAGIAKNALTDAVAYARHHARPIVHSSATRSTDDPYVRHAVGEISARAFAAEAAVMRAAASLDRALDADDDGGLLTEAAVDVAQAQFFAAESALRSAELAFDVGGASATLREHNLDRHWRNARTVANHNPRDWKAAVVGAYRLEGVEPPTSGLF